jgi:hypothetical protein
VVHVLTEVLRSIHQSLRAGGCLLVIQPAPGNALIEVEIGGDVKFSHELEEPNFLRYLEATKVSIGNAVGEGLYVIEDEGTTPDEGLYHCSEYSSLDEWILDRKPFCEDWDAFHAMSATIRELVGREEHRILEYYREHTVLLRRC